MSPWSPQRGSSSRLWGERGSCSDDCRMHHRSPIYTVRLIADDSYSGVCDVTQTVRNVALHIFYHEVKSGNCAVGSNFHTSEWQSHATIVSSSRNIIYETYLGLEKRSTFFPTELLVICLLTCSPSKAEIDWQRNVQNPVYACFNFTTQTVKTILFSICACKTGYIYSLVSAGFSSDFRLKRQTGYSPFCACVSVCFEIVTGTEMQWVLLILLVPVLMRLYWRATPSNQWYWHKKAWTLFRCV